MPLHIIIDIAILLIIAFCTWNGYKKGLIMTFLGVVVLFVSISGAKIIAGRYTDKVAESVAPILGWVTDDAVDNALADAAYAGNASDSENVVQSAFTALGIHSGELDRLSEMVGDWMEDTKDSMRAGVASVFLRLAAYIILFVFSYIVITMLFMLLTQLVASLFNIPPLKLLDSIGGLVLGVVFGCVIMFFAGWVLRFTGLFITPEVLQKTLLAKFFMTANPLAALLRPML